MSINDGAVIHALAGLWKLDSLAIGNARVDNFTKLESLRRLRRLELSLDHNVGSFEWLLRLGELTELSLIDCEYEDVSTIARLTKLKRLTTSGGVTQVLPELGAQAALSELWVMDCPVGDLSPIRLLSYLRSLVIYSVPIADLWPTTKLKSLEVLTLWKTNVVDLSPIAGLTNLRFLDISESNVDDIRALEGLTKLTELRSPSVKSGHLAVLTALPSLKTLFVAEMDSDEIVAPLLDRGIELRHRGR